MYDKKFQIYMFGVTQDGNTVCINIKNFKAFFYLKVKSGEEWNDFMVKQPKLPACQKCQNGSPDLILERLGDP